MINVNNVALKNWGRFGPISSWAGRMDLACGPISCYMDL